MVVKAIINAIGKGKPNQKNFLKAQNLKTRQSNIIRRCSKVKVEKINAGKLKLDRKQ